MEKEQLIQELKYIMLRAVFLDISAYLISVFFIGFTISMALGLALGTFGMCINLILLNNSIRNIVKKGAERAGQKMFAGYLIRIGITSVIIAASMLIPFVNTVGTVIPYFYVNIVYVGKAFLKKGDKTE